MKWLLRRFRQLLLILWILVILAFGIWFGQENSQHIQVTIIGYKLPESSAASYLGAALVIGAFLGWLVTYLSVQKKVSAKKRDLRKAQKEVSQLRATYGNESNP